MRLLTDILYKAGLKEIIGTTNVAVSSITFDSRKVKKDSLFIAVRGTAVDGHSFITQAIETGAIAIVCEELPETQLENITYVKVKNANYALGIIAANFYDNPSQKLKLVGVTGTNGKTTIATLLYKLFRDLGYKCGLLSTVENQINGRVIQATHTTPDPVVLNELMNEMVDEGCDYCFMEVSS